MKAPFLKLRHKKIYGNGLENRYLSMAFLLLMLSFFSVHALDYSDDSVCAKDRQFRMGFMTGGYTAPEIQRCMNHFDEGSGQRKASSNVEACQRDCSTSIGRSKCTKSLLEVLVTKCDSDSYKCIQKGNCRIAVDNLLACKKDVGNDCSTKVVDCTTACTPEPGNRCIAEDLKDFQHGRTICATGATAKTLIPDAEVQKIIDTRTNEITTNAVPQSEEAKTSIFYGDNPIADERSDGKTTGGPEAEDSDIKGENAAAKGEANGGSGSTNSNNSNGGGGSGGGEMMSAAASGSSSGGGSGSLPALNFPDFGGGATSSSSSSSFAATSSGGSSSSLDAVGGSGKATSELGGESWGDGPSSKTFGNNVSTASGGQSSLGGGGGLASPFAGSGAGGGNLTTASRSTGRGAAAPAGSVESAAFQSGFHKARPADKKGVSKLNRRRMTSKNTPRAVRRKGDGAMNLRRLLSGSKRGVAYESGGSSYSYSKDVGRGPHPVFRTLNSYYDRIELDMLGNIEH